MVKSFEVQSVTTSKKDWRLLIINEDVVGRIYSYWAFHEPVASLNFRGKKRLLASYIGMEEVKKLEEKLRFKSHWEVTKTIATLAKNKYPKKDVKYKRKYNWNTL